MNLTLLSLLHFDLIKKVHVLKEAAAFYRFTVSASAHFALTIETTKNDCSATM